MVDNDRDRRDRSSGWGVRDYRWGFIAPRIAQECARKDHDRGGPSSFFPRLRTPVRNRRLNPTEGIDGLGTCHQGLGINYDGHEQAGADR